MTTAHKDLPALPNHPEHHMVWTTLELKAISKYGEDCARAAIARPEPASAPVGYVLVPVEPTPEMRKAAQRAEIDLKFRKDQEQEVPYQCAWPSVWPAMLQAAPQCQQSVGAGIRERLENAGINTATFLPADPVQETGRVRVGTFKWNGVSRPQVWFDDVPLFGEESMQSPEADHVEAFGKYIAANLNPAPAQPAVDERAKACVAACANIPTYQLYDVGGAPNDLGAMIDHLREKANRPAVDLVAAILELKPPELYKTWGPSYRAALSDAANLVAAHVKGGA